ncbi:MAG: Trk system potassium transporter TrkA [Oscillospiraceae bacterium]|nr:Trk system potassium transporter TrkA [Oscillospiraceae bacterium]
MYIIIVGLGKLGSTLTKQLSTEGHDIVVVDPDNSVVSSTVDAYDVMGICGNGATYEVLKEAGAAKAKLIIAATGSDELNILCCLFAKHMGTENTIARVRNPDYAGQSQFLRNDLGISMTVNPEYETANEISRIIRFPSAANLDSFAGGRVEIARVRIHSDNPLCDMPIHEMRKKTKAKVIICAVQRNDSVFIPSGDFVLHCDDVISITGTRAELSSFMKQTGVYKQKIKNVMIVGGGRIAYYLAKLLSDTGRNIKLIELNDERCRHMSDMLDDVTVIHGDGTDQDILEEQCIDGQDALIALTGIDEENIIVSMYAESKGVNKVITKVNRHSYSILNDIGLETVVSPQIVAGNLVTRYVRALHNSAGNSQIQTLYKLVGGKVEAAEFIVPEDAGYLNIPFKELELMPNLLIGCIIRNGKIIFPGGDDVMKANDSVIVVTAGRIIEDLHDIFM